jgi:SSS family solute:Na+ symporter
MYAYYFNSEAIRWLVVVTAFLYSLFYTAVQIMAAAALFYWTAGVPVVLGAIIMAFICWLYVATGGMKGIIMLGFYVISLPEFGGWKGFSAAVAALDKKFLEVPRIMNFGLGGAKGEVSWTAVMVLTYMFSLMGIQSSPAFTMNFIERADKESRIVVLEE